LKLYFKFSIVNKLREGKVYYNFSTTLNELLRITIRTEDTRINQELAGRAGLPAKLREFSEPLELNDDPLRIVLGTP